MKDFARRFKFGYVRFFVKVYLVGAVRACLLFFAPPPNRNGWGKRILIVNPGFIGDQIMFTGVLKHYREAFPGKYLSLLIGTGAGANSSTGMSPSVLAPFVDRVLGVNTREFAKNPWYGAKLVRMLRSIGFCTVIDQNPGTIEITGKTIAVNLGSREVIGFEGASIDIERPANNNTKPAAKYVKKHIFPRFSKIIPPIKEQHGPVIERVPNYLRYYGAIFEGATGISITDFTTVVTVDTVARENMKHLLLGAKIAPGSFCLMAPGASSAYKGWGAKKFAALARLIKDRGIPIIVTGSDRDRSTVQRFRQEYGDDFLDCIGKTSIDELIALAEMSLLCIGNDSSLAHIAIALKKPSLIVAGLGQFGISLRYGYQDINRWVYNTNQPCLNDNWHCQLQVPPGSSSPCLASISVEQARTETMSLIDYLSSAPGYPKEKFRVEF
jgi:ADP-heptose:LPS heptosyltransferase